MEKQGQNNCVKSSKQEGSRFMVDTGWTPVSEGLLDLSENDG